MGVQSSGRKDGRLVVLAQLPFEVALVASLGKISEGQITAALVILVGGVVASVIAVMAVRRL